jgi:malate permease and related proteins
VLETVLRLLPIIVGIAAGYSLRRLGMVDHRDGETVFKLVFYVFLPAALFASLSTVELGRQIAMYPVAAAVIIVTGYIAGRLTAAKAKFDPVKAAVAVTACMIVNSGFALPFVQALYGQEGVARIAAFDAVNTTVTMTWAYYLAARGNPRHQGGSLLLSRLARSPALYATGAGLLVNIAGVQVPAAVADPAARFGSATAVVISVGIGILFDPLGGSLRRPGLIVAARLSTGLAVATALVLLLDLGAMDRTIVLLLGAAPVAFSVVTFASLENLDIRLATSTLSLSLATGLTLSLLITLISA